MIVCHCNRIDHVEITRAAEGMATEQPWALITPVAVYQRLGKAPCCGGCLMLAGSIIDDLSTAHVPPGTQCPMADSGRVCAHTRPAAQPLLAAE